MKNLKNKVVSCVLAAVTTFTVSVSVKKFEPPIIAHAASGEEFLSEVALVYEDTPEAAQRAIEGTNWKLYDKDLNKDTQLIDQDGVYLVYQTSTNVEDAITDLRVMDMYGGYTTTNYQREMEKSRQEYESMIDELRVAANEFAEKYKADDEMAHLAYRQMNYYQDVKTENGTETGKKMGDFFLNMPADNDEGNKQIIQVLFEGNSVVVINLLSLLAVGISGNQGDSFATRVATTYAKKDTYGVEEYKHYYTTASALANSFDVVKGKLSRVEELLGKYDLDDEEMTEEEYDFLTEYASLSDLMTKIVLEETADKKITLADFIKGQWATTDLYYIIDAMSHGQRALAEMGQLETILKYNAPSKPIEELTEIVEDMEATMKEGNNGVLPIFNVYEGVDRSIFKGDFALTNAAERQQALTGKTWGAADAWSRGLAGTIGYIAASAVDVGLAAFGAGIIIRGKMLEKAEYLAIARADRVLAKSIGGKYATADAALKAETAANNAQAAAAKKFSAFECRWEGVPTGLFTAAIAIAVVILGSYGISSWVKYYEHDYLAIPNTLIDVKETDVGDKYIKYTAAKVFGEEEETNADFNAFEGKEWNALYYTKDATAGNCLTPNFRHSTNSSTVARRHQGISMFGEDVAFNLNSHVYNGNALGAYLTVRYSTAKKAAVDMPTVVGSIFGGAYYVLAAVGGAALGVGGMALFQHLKKKKGEVVTEEATTDGE